MLEFSFTGENECTLVALHPTEKRAVAAFADGYMRFLDLQSLKNLGRVRITQERVSSIAFSQTGGSFLFGDRGGSLNFVAIEAWDPLTIKHQEIGVLECGIDSIAF